MLTIFRILLLTVEVLSAFLLIGVILLQRSKQQGAGMMFGAGVGESLFGAQVGNVLTRATVILAAIFLVCTTLLAYIGMAGGRSGSVTETTRPAAAPVARQPAPTAQPVAPEGAFAPDAGFAVAPEVPGSVVTPGAGEPSGAAAPETPAAEPAAPAPDQPAAD
jgi:preprotein translocase subunit SecG